MQPVQIYMRDVALVWCVFWSKVVHLRGSTMGWNGTSEMNTFRLLSTLLPHLSWQKCLFIHYDTYNLSSVRELPSRDNEQSRQWVGSHLTTWHNESSFNCSFKRKRRVFSSKFKGIIENVFRELTTVYINCWWWWWSQSSSQLAGSTASFGNWESLTGKERQQLYIQMDAGSKGPDEMLFFIQVILWMVVSQLVGL